MRVTKKNYFSKEISEIYTGSSEIKSFMKCEAMTLAKLRGEFIEETSDALLQSSYIDEYVSKTLKNFKLEHSELFTQKGELKSQYRNLDDIINQAKKDKMFWKYLQGTHQKVFTGEISGVKVKIKCDSYFKDKLICDLKAIKDLDLLWNEEAHEKQNFIDFYDYILQGTLYQEIVRQNTGKKLPFIIAVMTKEKFSERALLNIPQDVMDAKLEFLKNYLPHVDALKKGLIEPTYCGKCSYCKSIAKTTKIYDYQSFFERRTK